MIHTAPALPAEAVFIEADFPDAEENGV